MSQYFPKPYKPFGGDINVKVDLPNYATKADIKNISHVDTSNFALKTNLANWKTEVDKFDIDKLKCLPDHVSKLSNVVKKADYNKLVAKANNIDTSRFVLKTKYDTNKSELENKIPNISTLVKKTDHNTKITEIESKIPDISNFATKTALTNLSNAVPDISTLIKKVTMAQKLKKLRTSMLVILDLTQN